MLVVGTRIDGFQVDSEESVCLSVIRRAFLFLFLAFLRFSIFSASALVVLAKVRAPR